MGVVVLGGVEVGLLLASRALCFGPGVGLRPAHGVVGGVVVGFVCLDVGGDLGFRSGLGCWFAFGNAGVSAVGVGSFLDCCLRFRVDVLCRTEVGSRRVSGVAAAAAIAVGCTV